MFGWKDDALQRAMDADCYVNCPTLKTQSMDAMNSCKLDSIVDENVDGWLDKIPGDPAMELGGSESN
ncbi:hypothetical protein VTK73DRAFT_2122 [Phialemonium thermophilum]|uniref:Uncharacterized protein n=1 Tax=Phialemonium thermophilum TaxID=223376 RepID=A0ABR3VSK9_9PEZI